MRGPLSTKSRIGFFAGLLLFMVGVGTAGYLATRPGQEPAAEPRAQVFVTSGTVHTGTPGLQAMNQGLVQARTVEPAGLPAAAVTSASEITGGVAADDIPAGTVVTAGMFPAPQTRIGTVVIPPGRRALALRMEPVPGVAGFAGAGDRIDVYGVVQGTEAESSRVHLVLQGVEVLNVNGGGLPAAQGQADGPSLVYLLAVTPFEAERLIFLTEFNRLYFDLVPEGEAPVDTPGVGPAEALGL